MVAVSWWGWVLVVWVPVSVGVALVVGRMLRRREVEGR